MRATLIRRFVVLGLTLAAAAGCSSTVREGRSPVYLVLLNLEAAPGAEPDDMTNTLQSDVLTCGGVFEDPGRVTMRVQYKDPTAGTIDPVNFVTLNRYRIDFRRSDGRNVPGVDVPYGFDGAATSTIGPAMSRRAPVQPWMNSAPGTRACTNRVPARPEPSIGELSTRGPAASMSIHNEGAGAALIACPAAPVREAGRSGACRSKGPLTRS